MGLNSLSIMGIQWLRLKKGTRKRVYDGSFVMGIKRRGRKVNFAATWNIVGSVKSFSQNGLQGLA